MAETFTSGDQVAWDTPQGPTQGRIVRKLTSPMHIKGHHVAASKEQPRYLVESERSGAQAAHHPEALRRVKPHA